MENISGSVDQDKRKNNLLNDLGVTVNDGADVVDEEMIVGVDLSVSTFETNEQGKVMAGRELEEKEKQEGTAGNPNDADNTGGATTGERKNHYYGQQKGRDVEQNLQRYTEAHSYNKEEKGKEKGKEKDKDKDKDKDKKEEQKETEKDERGGIGE